MRHSSTLRLIGAGLPLVETVLRPLQVLVCLRPIRFFLPLIFRERALLGLLGCVAIEEQLLNQVVICVRALLVATSTLDIDTAFLERGRVRTIFTLLVVILSLTLHLLATPGTKELSI